MGTPDFSVPTLQSLIDSKHQVIAVVTQPDKPKGRGNEMSFPPVKEKALQYEIPIFQPVKVREEPFINTLKELNPDAIVVIAFGQIIPKSILDLPKYGCINIHASLLPKLRGAAPIQWAIINGEEETGITTMFMAEGLDTGDMLLKTVVPIEKEETGGSLHDKLSVIGGDIILETLEQLENGTAIRIKQDDKLSNYVGTLNKSLGNIDFSKPAKEIERLIRGLNPWPSAYTFLNGKMLKIWKASVIEKEYTSQTGVVVEVTKDEMIVKTGEGALAFKELQLEGKKRMTTDAFLRGYTIVEGTKFSNQR